MMVARQKQVRSPLNWIGGKYYSARQIVKAFPHPHAYDVYVEPFCGACHVIFAKEPHAHLEVINDLNGNLINFWIQARDNAVALQERLDSLPYARELYYLYRDTVRSNASMDTLERAVCWFYQNRSAFAGDHSWGYSSKNVRGNNRAQAYHSAVELLSAVAERFRRIQIDNREYEHVIKVYESPSTLFYVDPPYIGAEYYYERGTFTHERLSELLNNTPAMIALSYYEHPMLDMLYPPEKWRRITWESHKHAERTAVRQRSLEVLLMNYQPAELWETISC